jgi:hypothetical protein
MMRTKQDERKSIMSKLIHQQQPSRDEIARLAYELWEQNAKPAGLEVEFWLKAEQLLRSQAKKAPRQPQTPSNRARIMHVR